MRLLLDEHLSAAAIGQPLCHRGHDVLSVETHEALRGSADDLLLELAAAEERVVVTCNVGDFAQLAASWLEQDRDQAGCALLPGIQPHEYGVILRALDRAFEQYPKPSHWRNVTRWLAREPE